MLHAIPDRGIPAKCTGREFDSHIQRTMKLTVFLLRKREEEKNSEPKYKHWKVALQQKEIYLSQLSRFIKKELSFVSS